jgi:EAL domain-containing protein (putative c-di-GMP-specific phosphodiesterase class I)
MKHKIQNALQSNNYAFAMQPIFSRDGLVEKYESLVRLNISDTKELLPYEFFKEAERNESFKNMMIYSLQHAVEFLKTHSDKKIAINISYRDIAETEAINDFLKIITTQESELKKRIIIELIETYGIADIDKVIAFCKKVKEHNIKLSIDDFGIKNSNFYILSLIDIDYLKIDGHFIKNISSEKTKLIVEIMIGLCKKLNIRIIAEHIENEDDYSILKEMGVDFFQGFYLGKPSNNLFCEMYRNNEEKYKNTMNIFKNFCKRRTRFLYRLMKFCERLSGESKDIEVRQQKIKEELEEKVYVERELEFTQENIISKEEHIQRLYMFIETVAINFRDENYEEVDRLFRKINL